LLLIQCIKQFNATGRQRVDGLTGDGFCQVVRYEQAVKPRQGVTIHHVYSTNVLGIQVGKGNFKVGITLSYLLAKMMDKPQANRFIALTPELIDELTDIVFGVEMKLPAQPCDLIFVFGGSHPGLWEKAAEAYQCGLGREILVTGGHKPGVQPHITWQDGDTPEAHVLRRELIRLGVPTNVIFYEDRSTNTLENVLFAQAVYDFSKIKHILAVCKCYGVGRQCRTLQHNIDPAIQVTPYPFDTTRGNSSTLVTRQTWMNDAANQSFILAQAEKIYRYGKKGHLTPIEHLTQALEKILSGRDA
jgi:uncharacterized SAM-binding protein YcdF (DUF218 family)